MEPRLCCHGSIQDRHRDCGCGIDVKLLWKNPCKDTHQSQCNAFPEPRFVPLSADEARSNDGE